MFDFKGVTFLVPHRNGWMEGEKPKVNLNTNDEVIDGLEIAPDD